jgi:hypothetical protein
MDRRFFLGAGLGAAVLALGGVGLALRPGRRIAPPAGLRVLDDVSFSVLSALADRLCPAVRGLPSASALGVPALVDAQLARMHPADATELKQGLLLIENSLAGLIFDGEPTPFTLRSPAGQDLALLALRDSGLAVRRGLYKAVRGLIMAAYWGHPRMYGASGYDGPMDLRAAPGGAASAAGAEVSSEGM